MAVSAHKSDKGLVAKHNEDYVWANDDIGLFIVADGMGGHEAGDVASRLAATTIGEIVTAGLADAAPAPQAIQNLLTNAIEIANDTVGTASDEAKQTRRMGATIVVALLQAPALYIAHAGDARAYRIRNGEAQQLTEDDSWVAHLVSHGYISEKDGKTNRLSHVITKAIGQDGPVQPSISKLSVETGDWILLCSDGLWNMIPDGQILTIWQNAANNLKQLVEQLVEAANAAGGKDNISVIAIKI